eukprot:1800015-Alexandrium_andersonii.AAC.1
MQPGLQQVCTCVTLGPILRRFHGHVCVPTCCSHGCRKRACKHYLGTNAAGVVCKQVQGRLDGRALPAVRFAKGLRPRPPTPDDSG